MPKKTIILDDYLRKHGSANADHAEILRQGVAVWDEWRGQNHEIKPKLSFCDLHGLDLAEGDFRGVDLGGANLSGANLERASLYGANLRGVNFRGADLREAAFLGADAEAADFIGAQTRGTAFPGVSLRQAHLNEVDLRAANLRGADLSWAKLVGADLSGADLTQAVLVETVFDNANITACTVYGASVWNIRTEGAVQSNLLITPPNEPAIEVDNLEVAQFIYLLLKNEKVRHVIDTITSKTVLILGRFSEERKAVLDAIRNELRQRNYLPILFDFERPASRDLTETISTLAHMARFVIADITDAKSIPQELGRIVPGLPSVPVQPLLLASQQEYGMFEHFRRYPWVLEPVVYESQESLLAELQTRVIAPAEARAKHGV